MLSALLFNLYINALEDFLNKESNAEENQLHIPKLDKNLSFADNVATLSSLKYDLQKKISNLKIAMGSRTQFS